jgi:hypothetical protein
MAKVTKKSTRDELIALLVETRSSVKKDYLVYERILAEQSLPDFRKRACETECERLYQLIENIDVFSGRDDL